MFKRKAVVKFSFNFGDRQKVLEVPVDLLREQMKELKETDTQITIELEDSKKEIYEVEMTRIMLEKLIKQSDLRYKEIIPKILSNYIKDFTSIMAKEDCLPIVGRDDEINKVWFYLSQETRNNVFLVGDVDTGKSAIAKEIARQIVNNECPKEFKDYRVLTLDFEEIIDIKLNFKYEYIINSITNFLKENKSKVIVYVDNALYFRTSEELSNLLYSLMVDYSVPIILCSRIDEFESLYEKDCFIDKYENIIEVNEPRYTELYDMLKTKIAIISKKYNIEISEEMAKFVIYTSAFFNTVSCNPGRSLDIFEKASLYAKRNGKTKLDKESVLSCYNLYKKLYKAMGKEQLRVVAYHEAGHFLTLLKSKHITGEKTACVSIIPISDILGVNIFYPVLGQGLDFTREYMIDEIAVCLGGRVAEKEVTNTFSSGASTDLERANAMAEEMLIKYGLSEKDNINRSFIIDNYYIKAYLLTDNNKEKINSEIKAIMEEAYQRAEKIIKDNRQLLDIIVEKLLQEEIITGEELYAIVEKYERSK